MSVRMPASCCPFCQAELDAALMVPDGGPQVAPAAGDVTLCAYCGGVLVFDGEPLAVRAPTAAELREIEPLAAVHRGAAALAHLNGRNVNRRS